MSKQIKNFLIFAKQNEIRLNNNGVYCENKCKECVLSNKIVEGPCRTGGKLNKNSLKYIKKKYPEYLI